MRRTVRALNATEKSSHRNAMAAVGPIVEEDGISRGTLRKTCQGFSEGCSKGWRDQTASSCASPAKALTTGMLRRRGVPQRARYAIPPDVLHGHVAQRPGRPH